MKLFYLVLNGVDIMDNILQLNSRKGVVKFSEEDLINHDLFRWIRTSFKGIGKSGIIDELPFETKAADLYVKKYPDTQVVLAEKIFFNPELNEVSVVLKTTSTPENRYFNTHNTELVFSEKEIKKANFKKKVKTAISTSPEYGNHVQKVSIVDTDEPNIQNFKLSNSDEVLSLKFDDKNKPVIQEWPDVKGVPLYVGDIALLVSDFTGGIDSRSIRSLTLPSYSSIAPIKNLLTDDSSSDSFVEDKSEPEAIELFKQLEQFKQTMILLGLESTDKSDIDINKIFIDDDTWSNNYKPLIEENFNNFSIDSYNQFLDIVNQASQTELEAPEYELGSELTSLLINNLDFKDAYVENKDASEKSKNVKKVTYKNPSTYILTEDMKEAAQQSMEDSGEFSPSAFSQILAEENPEVGINTSYIASIIQKDIIKKEVSKLTSDIEKLSADQRSREITSSDKKYIKDFINKTYNRLSEGTSANDVSTLISLLTDYCSYFEDVKECLRTYQAMREQLLTSTNSGSITKDLISSLAFNTNNVTVDFSSPNQVLALKGVKDILTNLPEIIDDTFEESPFTFLTIFLEKQISIQDAGQEKKFVPFSSLNKGQKEKELKQLGVNKVPMSISEFFSRVLNDPIDSSMRKNFTDSSNADLLDNSGPETAERTYQQLVKSKWDSASAAEKEERLEKAYGANFISNPDFNNLIFQNRTPERDKKYKQLLAFHKYLIDNDIYDNVNEPGSGNKISEDIKDLFNSFISNLRDNEQKDIGLTQKIEELKKGNASLKESDPNYAQRKKENEDLINYYEKELQNTQSLDAIPTIKDYEEFITQQSPSNTNVYDTRELVKVIGFAIGSSPEAIKDYRNLKSYIREYGLSELAISEENIDGYVLKTIGNLQFENIRDTLIQLISEDSISDFVDYSEESLSYTSLKKMYQNILSKLSADISTISFEEFSSIVDSLTQNKNNTKLISAQELNKLTRLREKINSYVDFYAKQYVEHIKEEEKSLLYELEEYKNYLSQLSTDHPEYSDYVEAVKSIENDLASLTSNSTIDTFGLKTELLNGLPEDLLAFISISASNPNITIDNVDQYINKSKTAAFPAQMEINDILNALNTPELKANYDKLTLHKQSEGSPTLLKKEVNELAHKVQQTLIDEFIEDNPEIFGEDFTDEIGSSLGSGEVWVIGEMVTGTVADKSSSSLTAGQMIGCTSEQLLKISPEKINDFYNKYQKEKARDSGKTLNPESLNYFKSDEEKEHYNNSNFIPAVKDYKESEESLRGSDILNKVKSTTGLNEGLLSAGKPEVTTADEAQYSKVESLKSEKYRLQNKLENQVPVNFYSRKVNQKEKELDENTQALEMFQKELKELKASSGDNSDDFKEVSSNVDFLAKKVEADKKELELYTKELEKANKAEKWYKNKINNIEKKIKEVQQGLNKVSDKDLEKQKFYLQKTEELISNLDKQIAEAPDTAKESRLKEIKQKQIKQKEIIEKKIEDMELRKNKSTSTPQAEDPTHKELVQVNKKIEQIKSSREYKEALTQFNKEYLPKKKKIESRDIDDFEKEAELSVLNNEYGDLLTQARGFVKEIKELTAQKESLDNSITEQKQKSTKPVETTSSDDTSNKTTSEKKQVINEIKNVSTREILPKLTFDNRYEASAFFNNEKGMKSFIQDTFKTNDSGYSFSTDVSEIDENIINEISHTIADFMISDITTLSEKDFVDKWSKIVSDPSESYTTTLEDLYDKFITIDKQESKKALALATKEKVKIASVNKALSNIEDSLINTFIKQSCTVDMKSPVFDSIKTDEDNKEKIKKLNTKQAAEELSPEELEMYEDSLIDKIDTILNDFRALHGQDISHDEEEALELAMLDEVKILVDELTDLHDSYEYALNSYEQNSKMKNFQNKGNNFDATVGRRQRLRSFDPEVCAFEKMLREHYNKMSKMDSTRSLINNNQQTATDQLDGAIGDDPQLKTLTPSNKTMLSKRTSATKYYFDDEERASDDLQYDIEKIVTNIKNEINAMAGTVQEISEKDPESITEEDMLWLDYYTTLHEELKILERELNFED